MNPVGCSKWSLEDDGIDLVLAVWPPVEIDAHWRCKVSARAGGDEVERWYSGSDSLQALALAVGNAGEVARLLTAVASVTRFTVDVAVPARIPVTAGAGFYYEMCSLIDDRLKQIEADQKALANSFKTK